VTACAAVASTASAGVSEPAEVEQSAEVEAESVQVEGERAVAHGPVMVGLGGLAKGEALTPSDFSEARAPSPTQRLELGVAVAHQEDRAARLPGERHRAGRI